MRLAVDIDGPADHRSVAAELALPIAIGQHHRLRAGGEIVFLGEGTPENWLDTQDRQESVCDLSSQDVFGLSKARDVCRCTGSVHSCGIKTDVLEGAALFAKDKIVRSGKRPVDLSYGG